MAARPSWKGYLKLSLVSCPVQLYPATTSTEKISFNLLHKDTLNRVRMVPTDPELGPVERADLVKGYPIDKDRYIVVDEDEIAALQVESSKTIDVEGFVDPEAIGPLWLDAPYFVAPDGAVAAEAFFVIREAIARSGKTGLARVTIGSRERLVAMTACEGGVALYTLREAREVRRPSEIFGDLEPPPIPEEMLDLALEIVKRKTVEFDPASYEDRYQKALRELIQAKLEGAKPVQAKAAPEPGKVINIMDALKKSLEQSKSARPANDDAPAAAAKKTRAKKSDARQRSMLLPLAGGAKAEKAAAEKPAAEKTAKKRKRA
jgi:DNA end-binding protein Ku